MDILDSDLVDQNEALKIILEVFFDFIPESDRIKAMAQAAERIEFEIKEPNRLLKGEKKC